MHILQEKIVIRASDIDTIYVNGYGFPIYRGGPMFYAEQVGLDVIARQLHTFAKKDPDDWSISPLLETLLEGQKKLSQYKVTT